MDNNLNKGVEEVVTDAPVTVEGVEETNQVAPPDYEKEFNALLEENARIANDRDNYKKGLLQAKGKLPQDLGIEELDLETLVERKVQDTLLRTKEFQNEQAKQDLIKNIVKENKELKLALQNKGGISRVAGGSSAGSPETKVSAWTPEQIEYFKKRGLSPDKVKDNYTKFKLKSI